MIKSETSDFYKLPDMYGVTQASWRPEHRTWLKKHAMQFLVDLEARWTTADMLYGQIDDYGDFEPILLGDLSVEGGAKHKWDKMKDHKSHLSGVDMDIYIFRNGNHTVDKQRSIGTDTFDAARTFEMTKLIFEIGGPLVKMVFFDDLELINKVKGAGYGGNIFFGPDTGRPAHGDSPAVPPTPHRDHLHVRLALTA